PKTIMCCLLCVWKICYSSDTRSLYTCNVISRLGKQKQQFLLFWRRFVTLPEWFSISRNSFLPYATFMHPVAHLLDLPLEFYHFPLTTQSGAAKFPIYSLYLRRPQSP